ncbi:MAG: TonB-dependent receptor [Gemmatimonadota bacterium]
MRLALIALLCCAAGTLHAQGTRRPISFVGVVRDSATGEALPHARVTIVDIGRSAETNADGRFVLVNVPVATHTVRVHYIGYRPFEKALDGDAMAKPLTVALVRSAVLLAGTKTVADPEQGMAPVVASGVSHTAISPALVEAMPSLGEVDVFRALQMLPSVSGTGDGTASLSVRGGSPDQNLVLLDGMTVYHVDHFFGMFSAFNNDALKDIQLYAGGFPARYGGRLSSVVDLTGKAGDEHTVRGSMGMNLLGARGEMEIPLGKGSWLLSARRSYTDVIQSGLYNKLFAASGGTSATTTNTTAGGNFPGGPGAGRNRFQQQTVSPTFYFYDLNSKLTYRPTEKDFLALSFYAGRDNLDQSQAAPTGGGPFGPGGLVGTTGTTPSGVQDLTAWGNHGASGRWFRQWSDRLSSDALVAASRYTSDGSRTASGGALGGGARFDFGLTETNRVDDLTFRVDNEFRVAQWSHIAFGTWITRNRVTYDFLVNSDTTQRNRNTSRDGRALLSAAYAQHVWTPVSAIELTTGVRASQYDATATTYLEPRLSLTAQLQPWLQWKGAWGRYHQFVSRVENEDVLQGSRDFWLLADSSLMPSAAEHRIVGLSVERPRWTLNVEAYEKTLSNVALFSRRYRDAFGVNTGSFFYQGSGNVRGLEFMASKKAGALTGWVSYTLSKGTNTFAAVDNGTPFPSQYDQRHEAKTFAAYALGSWELSATTLYGSGRPYTAPESQYEVKLLDGTTQSYVHVGAKNGERLPAYERADLAVSRLFRTDAFDWKLGLSFYNVTNRRNVSYRKFDLSQSPVSITDVTQLGFIPSIDLKVTLRDIKKVFTDSFGGNR